MGVVGISVNDVQGAAHAGAAHVVAVDPVPVKQEKARELGATETFAGRFGRRGHRQSRPNLLIRRSSWSYVWISVSGGASSQSLRSSSGSLSTSRPMTTIARGL